tara:strand:+ start:368 stop:592 length:225 start_codon:yes stop_codon:yes gene_type:complete
MKKYKIQHWLRDTLLALIGVIVALPIFLTELTKWIKARRGNDDTVINPATKKKTDTWGDDMRKEFSKHIKNNNK